MARSAVPSRDSIADTAIQWLSAVLGSVVDTPLALALSFDDFETVVLATIVLVITTAGFTAGPLPGSGAGAGSTPPLGTLPSGESVSPAGAVAPAG